MKHHIYVRQRGNFVFLPLHLWIPHKHNPGHEKERNNQTKEQTNHNKEKIK
jgi:hypothetical protein